MKNYKIGMIAELAGVSKRTVDYYTNLGLLDPLRSESNYRYYSQEALFRLKLIKGLKKERLTLKEIRKRLSLLDNNQVETGINNDWESISIHSIERQLKLLEKQIVQLHSAVSGLDPAQVTQLTKQVLIQSMVLLNTIILYINEVISQFPNTTASLAPT